MVIITLRDKKEPNGLQGTRTDSPRTITFEFFNMSKIEKVSLLLVIASVCVGIIALQMDYGSVRKLMVMLSVALLILAMDPTLSLYKKKKQKNFYVDEPEEKWPGRIWLSSAFPVDSVDRKWLEGRDVYLKFLDIESDDDYFIHYVNGKADETYVGGLYYLENQDFDELFEGYETLDGVLAAAKNEEIEGLSLISPDDFGVVKYLYRDWQMTYGHSPEKEQTEPVNRVGKVVAYMLAALGFVGICTAVYMWLF